MNPPTVHGEQLGLDTLFAAATEKTESQRKAARRTEKGAAVSRDALRTVPKRSVECCVLDALEALGSGTAEQIGAWLAAHRPTVSSWGPQVMSSVCNALLRRRLIFRAGERRRNRSGRTAAVWRRRTPLSVVRET